MHVYAFNRALNAKLLAVIIFETAVEVKDVYMKETS